MATKPTVDAYLAALPDDARATLEKLRRTIKAAVPAAVEAMAYGMPGFKYRGRPLIYIGAAKSHCAIYGMSAERHRAEADGYDTSKGTIRFAIGKPPPARLVKAMLKDRIAAIDAAEAARKRKKSSAGESRR